jgi:alkanesulfonate monooxygenase SsuD/methylene tetrahydromethanopterin reductase-like flavin-dependent oxidoreductase (luciferase family)
VTAGSIATIDELAPGRTIIGWGVGDTAVRLAGLRPARVKELEAGTRLMRALLDGESVDVGAEQPARLPHHRPVPIWIAAGGPRTLRMAGGVADGVFIRVGTHPANISTAVEAIRAGAAEAGRDPGAVRLGAVFHTVLVDEPGLALTMAKSMAAGYFEYSPTLFDPPRLEWTDQARRRSSGTGRSFPISITRRISRRVAAPSTSFPRARRTRSACAADRRGRGSAHRRASAGPAEFDYVVLHPSPTTVARRSRAWLYRAGGARGAAARALALQQS